MPKQPLIAVLDETGTTNVPQSSEESDFGVGVILLEEDQVQQLAEASKRIGRELSKSDFKYKHVQKSTPARKHFLSAVNKLDSPSGVFGFFASGGSLWRERQRSQEGMQSQGIEDDGGMQAAIERFKHDERNAHLEEFLGFFAPCINVYAGSIKRSVNLYWDRRTDLDAIQAFCQQHVRFYTDYPGLGDISSLVNFGNEATGDLAAIARLAGVLAGDVRRFFQRHGDRVWERLVDSVSPYGNIAEQIFTTHRSEVVAVVNELLADRNFKDGSSESCMLQGYSQRFIRQSFSFAAPTGVMGHIQIHNGNRWEIRQESD
jgi:hypothetical protein